MKHYFCFMKGQTAYLSFLILFTFNICEAQTYFKTADLFPNTEGRSGKLNIFQDLNVDTLVSRYVLANKVLTEGTDGDMEGYRIQIYRSSNRNAREESNKVRADFMIEFPDLQSYADYDKPGYFLVRVGDFRTRMESAKALYLIRKKYPNAYIVPCLIKFPDLNKN
jgi:hypothetical protein